MQANVIEDAIGTLETVLVHERELLMRGQARETAALVGEKMSALQVFDDVVLFEIYKNIGNIFNS